MVQNNRTMHNGVDSEPFFKSYFVNFLFPLLYEFVLWIIALLALPRFIYAIFAKKKYRTSILPRLGIYYPNQKYSLPAIWIHAVSVGETKAIVSIARELKHLYPENPLIISSVTETGHEEAKRSLPFANEHVYLPFDFKWIVSKVIARASPAVVLLSESDFWFNFLDQAKKKGAALALINGKMSEKSMRRFSFASFFSKKLFNMFDILCVQNALYHFRLIKSSANPEKVFVTGNLKFDDEYPQLVEEDVIQWRQKLGILANQLVLTIGSTHWPEEKLLVKILKKIWAETPELRVILVPRRPESFKTVSHLLESEGLTWINFTDIQQRKGKEQVILMDVMGLLRMCYQLSDFALIGGSFVTQVGGHNILEPCWYGKPVLFGPYMHNQIELVELMTKYGAGIRVNLENLQSTLERWIQFPNESKAIGSRGFDLVNDLKGSTKKTLQMLQPCLTKLKGCKNL